MGGVAWRYRLYVGGAAEEPGGYEGPTGRCAAANEGAGARGLGVVIGRVKLPPAALGPAGAAELVGSTPGLSTCLMIVPSFSSGGWNLPISLTAAECTRIFPHPFGWVRLGSISVMESVAFG